MPFTRMGKIVACTVALSVTPPLAADHGPGTSGGGSTTQSGETLKKGEGEFSLRYDYTQYESLSEAEMRNMAAKVNDGHAHVDALRWSQVVTLELAYGFAESFQLGLSTGWYRGDDLREAHIHGSGTAGFHELGDVTGMTDLWINSKYRVLKGPWGSLAAFGGLKLPTGRDDVRGEGETERLEPALQPGSGAFDFLVGGAYSVWLTPRITLDSSAGYTFRTENDDFQIGNRFDAGVAVAYRLIEDIQQFPQVRIFGEANVRHLEQNDEDGNKIENSGGTVLFLSPGVRVGFTPRIWLTVAPRIPVVQALNSEQQDTLFQVASSLTFTF